MTVEEKHTYNDECERKLIGPLNAEDMAEINRFRGSRLSFEDNMAEVAAGTWTFSLDSEMNIWYLNSANFYFLAGTRAEYGEFSPLSSDEEVSAFRHGLYDSLCHHRGFDKMDRAKIWAHPLFQQTLADLLEKNRRFAQSPECVSVRQRVKAAC